MQTREGRNVELADKVFLCFSLDYSLYLILHIPTFNASYKPQVYADP